MVDSARMNKHSWREGSILNSEIGESRLNWPLRWDDFVNVTLGLVFVLLVL